MVDVHGIAADRDVLTVQVGWLGLNVGSRCPTFIITTGNDCSAVMIAP